MNAELRKIQVDGNGYIGSGPINGAGPQLSAGLEGIAPFTILHESKQVLFQMLNTANLYYYNI